MNRSNRITHICRPVSTPLLQTSLYVVDLLSNANYGPYLMMSMAPVDEDTFERSEQAFLADFESGKNVLLSEHRLVGLLRHKGRDIRWLLTEADLRQYPDNEHRLLIVLRAIQFLDDVNGWVQAEPILRAAVQYLASRPDTNLVHTLSTNLLPWPAEEEVSQEQVLAALGRLIDAPFGNEPEIIRDMVKDGASGRTLYESIALASSEMLRRSRFDAHAVTGIHCSLDLLWDKEVPAALRTLAGHIALSSQRSRRQKLIRSEWREYMEVIGIQITLTEVEDIIQQDNEGLLSAQSAGSVLAGRVA